MYNYFAKDEDDTTIVLHSNTSPPKNRDNVILYLCPREFQIAELLLQNLTTKQDAEQAKINIIATIDLIIAKLFPE